MRTIFSYSECSDEGTKLVVYAFFLSDDSFESSKLRLAYPPYDGEWNVDGKVGSSVQSRTTTNTVRRVISNTHAPILN